MAPSRCWASSASSRGTARAWRRFVHYAKSSNVSQCGELMTLLEISQKLRAIEERKNARAPMVLAVAIVAVLAMTFVF